MPIFTPSKLRSFGAALIFLPIFSFLLFTPFSLSAKENQAHGDWMVFYPDANAPNQAYMMHMIGEAKAKKPILSIVIGNVKGKTTPIIDFQIPPQAKASKELQIIFENDKKNPYYLFIEGCNADLCHAYGALTDQIASKFQTSESGSVRFKLEDGQAVSIQFSLKGFDSAYQIFKENN